MPLAAACRVVRLLRTLATPRGQVASFGRTATTRFDDGKACRIEVLAQTLLRGTVILEGVVFAWMLVVQAAGWS